MFHLPAGNRNQWKYELHLGFIWNQRSEHSIGDWKQYLQVLQNIRQLNENNLANNFNKGVTYF